MPFDFATAFGAERLLRRDRRHLLGAAQEDRHVVAEPLVELRFDPSSPASPSASRFGVAKITLPLARKVATSSKPIASKWRRSSSFLIRRPPRFIPRRKAT